mmetsp:Transcript_44015/g.145843  ORF Transcript_44015/g.145843 Transcript_44015/m.145843 type:complete len:203 (-) Transcript_44015:7-615(-)
MGVPLGATQQRDDGQEEAGQVGPATRAREHLRDDHFVGQLDDSLWHAEHEQHDARNDESHPEKISPPEGLLEEPGGQEGVAQHSDRPDGRDDGGGREAVCEEVAELAAGGERDSEPPERQLCVRLPAALLHGVPVSVVRQLGDGERDGDHHIRHDRHANTNHKVAIDLCRLAGRALAELAHRARPEPKQELIQRQQAGEQTV